MATENFSAARLRALLHYNPATGEFRWLANRGPNKTAGNVAGSLVAPHGYARKSSALPFLHLRRWNDRPNRVLRQA